MVLATKKSCKGFGSGIIDRLFGSSFFTVILTAYSGAAPVATVSPTGRTTITLHTVAMGTCAPHYGRFSVLLPPVVPGVLGHAEKSGCGSLSPAVDDCARDRALIASARGGINHLAFELGSSIDNPAIPAGVICAFR